MVQMQAAVPREYPFYQPYFYAGVTAGYGRTTWDMLVTTDTLPSFQVSTPIDASNMGIIWGGFIGYQFTKLFAIEAAYERYPDTVIYLPTISFYPVDQFTSHTEIFSAIMKFILPLGHSKINAFLDAGV